jgi:phospholipase A-2-activating protein
VIDLSRLVIGYNPGAFAAPNTSERFLGALFKAAEWDEPWASSLTKHRETNTLLLLRTLANAFQEGSPFAEADVAKKVRTLFSL